MTDTYYSSLPKKRMAAGVLILNDQQEVLIVKQSYKNYWSIPGGVVEENESPYAAALREVEEEVGLTLERLKFLCVDYMPSHTTKGECLQFIFSAGKIDDNTLKKIKLQAGEIVEYQFLNINQALPLLNENLRPRLERCFEALRAQVAVYLENGKEV